MYLILFENRLKFQFEWLQMNLISLTETQMYSKLCCLQTLNTEKQCIGNDRNRDFYGEACFKNHKTVVLYLLVVKRKVGSSITTLL